MVNQLPQGWKEEELGKLAEVSCGDSAPQSSSYFLNGSYPFCRTSDVGKIHRSSNFSEIEDHINETAISKLHLFRKGTILFPKSGASTLLNHRVMLSIDSYVSSHLATIYANGIDRYYLYYFLCIVDAKQLVPNLDYPSLKISELKNIKIPYPTDRDEQNYIVKTLDAVAEMIRLRKETIQLTKDLIPAIFQEMFGNPIKNSKAWTVDRLGNQAKIVGGGTPKTSEPSFWNGNVPWITPKDLSVSNSLTIRNGERFITEEGLKNSSAEMLPAETVLFTSRAPIGYLAIAKNPLCTNQGFKNFICGSNLVPLYLLFYLDQIMDVVKGMASGATFKEISASTAKQIPILCPPLRLQEEFADKVEQINQNLEVQRKDLDRLQELFNQLLQKAFTGELTRGEAYGII